MRILSQDGKIDIPYEQMVINIDYTNERNIAACGTNCDNEDGYITMAEYSTEAKARKAMEMLRNAYSPKIEIKEPVEKEIPKPRSGDWCWTITQPKVEVLDNFYFRFPQDREVEV